MTYLTEEPALDTCMQTCHLTFAAGGSRRLVRNSQPAILFERLYAVHAACPIQEVDSYKITSALRAFKRRYIGTRVFQNILTTWGNSP
jgi:hypothetical protein